MNDLQDLFTGLTTAQTDYVQRRYHDALWYAFGWEDATGENIDVFGFAVEAAFEARAYATGATHTLASVQDQYKKYMA